MKKWITFSVIVVVGCTVWLALSRQKTPSAKQSFKTVPLSRATITQDVSASGTIKPIKEVEVGTQVTGSILNLMVDYNSTVKAGQVIARIDPATYQATYDASTAQVNAARAALESARAQLASAEAALQMTQTKLKFSKRELERVIALHSRKMVSDSEFDNQSSECEQLEAQLKSNEASILQAKSAITQAEASIQQHEAAQRQAKANLDYCTISSPVDGIVLGRDVDEGQTVVSNMSASTLFTIATDLSRIQVEASVPEADIGQVACGQKVIFSVDAYKMDFIGVVKEIRLDAKTESNVVTYPVIVEADNPGEKLYPGMTANLSIIVVEKQDVLSVPAAALRFKGPADSTAPQPSAEMKSRSRTIWLLDHDEPRPVAVTLGATDGVMQEVICDEPLEGKMAITGVLTGTAIHQKPEQGSNNPFAPKMPKPKPQKPAGQ